MTSVIVVLLCGVQIDQKAWVGWVFWEFLFIPPVLLWLRNTRFDGESSLSISLSSLHGVNRERWGRPRLMLSRMESIRGSHGSSMVDFYGGEVPLREAQAQTGLTATACELAYTVFWKR